MTNGITRFPAGLGSTSFVAGSMRRRWPPAPLPSAPVVSENQIASPTAANAVLPEQVVGTVAWTARVTGSSRVTSQLFASRRLNSPAHSEPAAHARSPMSAPAARAVDLAGRGVHGEQHGRRTAGRLRLASATLTYSVPSDATTCPPIPVTWSSTTITPVAVPPVPPDPGVGQRQVERRRALRLQLVGRP